MISQWTNLSNSTWFYIMVGDPEVAYIFLFQKPSSTKMTFKITYKEIKMELSGELGSVLGTIIR